MKLALRRTAAENATWVQRQFAALTRWRLCSVYCHAGIVIGERMYQVNAAFGCTVGSSMAGSPANTDGIRAYIDELVIVKGWAGDLSGMTSEIVL